MLKVQTLGKKYGFFQSSGGGRRNIQLNCKLTTKAPSGS